MRALYHNQKGNYTMSIPAIHYIALITLIIAFIIGSLSDIATYSIPIPIFLVA